MKPTQSPVSFTFGTDEAPDKDTHLIFMRKGDKRPAGLERALNASGFQPDMGSHAEILAPEGSGRDRVVVLGAGDPKEDVASRWLRLGGVAYDKLRKVRRASVDLSGLGVEDVADFTVGATMRAYGFSQHKSKPDETPKLKISLRVDDAAAARKAVKVADAVAEGVYLARDLVNEPANVLTPKAFAKRVKKGAKALDLDCEVLKTGDMRELGMRALLGVAQGSQNRPRMVILHHRGGKEGDPTVAFVGKGVTFDTGGISIKPSSGMEDMKGDMGGAAAVAGLMHALAARDAKVNAVGVLALVENMPDGKAQRPGDIVEAMSGTTIEILNTDAEGRLVLADAMWHVQNEHEPNVMIDLATLTGAIMVALGHERAGLYSNSDDLAGELSTAGEASGDLVWRMPLGKAYDKLIKSKNADIKNTGGRLAGSVTAAQFLQRFVKDGVDWAHLDIAGTAMGSPSSDVNSSWGSGFGVRLLDRWVRDRFES